MPWLIGIARHRLIDHYRVTAAEERRYRPIDSGTVELADDRDDFAVVLDRQQAIAALDALPASQRLVISLRYLDGLSVPEIARASPRIGACRRIAPRARPRNLQTDLSGARS